MNEKIPVPITFNTHKHHLKFLLGQIEIWKNMHWNQAESELFTIGENLLDFYIGDLSVENICNECILIFENNKIYSKSDFIKWLFPLEYRKIKLSDSSEWVIREGKDAVRFMHIHPAKQSLHTIRVRAATLKTVLGVMIRTDNNFTQININLKVVNDIRVIYLKLSPVKSLQRGKGILKLLELFVSHYQPHFR
jgi:hypothetical protein